MKYYVWFNGAEAGPFSVDELQNSVRSGTFPSAMPARVASYGSTWSMSQLMKLPNPRGNSRPVVPSMSTPTPQPMPIKPKSRLAYILLALFIGTLGIHNFYVDRTGRGFVQFLLTLTIIGWFLSLLWSVMDIITIDTDGNGIRMV